MKSNNGKQLGHIKKISKNHFRVEIGSVRKKSFWVPKNLADAYDGKYLWLRNNEEEIHDTFFYGEEPTVDEKVTPVEKIRVVKERVSGVPTDRSSSSEPYKNMRDLK